MTAACDQTYRAVGIAKKPIGHAHIVALFVELNGSFGLLRHAVSGENHFYTGGEFDEYVALGRATRFTESVDVSADETGLVLTSEIPELLTNSGTDLFDDFRGPIETQTAHVVYLGAKDLVIRLRNAVAAQLTVLIRSRIVDKFVAEALGAEADLEVPTWQDLTTWTEYAIDCGAGGMDHQYQPVLVRCLLLRRQLESTQIRNFYQQFLGELLSWDEFQVQLDLLENTIYKNVEKRLQYQRLRDEQEHHQKHMRSLSQKDTERDVHFRDSDPSAGSPRQFLH